MRLPPTITPAAKTTAVTAIANHRRFQFAPIMTSILHARLLRAPLP
jgi:hypothetical protein